MAAKTDQSLLISFWSQRCKQLLQMRNNLPRDDLEYVAEKVSTFKDTRLQQCITTLIGWGDDERAELETFCAIALELMKDLTPSQMHEAARKVEIRFLNKGTT